MPTLTAGDGEAISSECPAVLAASPLVLTAGQVIYGNANWKPRRCSGSGRTTSRCATGRSSRRLLHRARRQSAAKVCVIGQTVVARLFQTTNPSGETIRIKNIPFRVVGVLEEKGANLVGDDQDDIVLMPYTTARSGCKAPASTT